MPARLFVVDGGGVARLVKADRFFVVDGGGVTRKLKRLFVIDAGGARQVYQAATYALPAGGADVDALFSGTSSVTTTMVNNGTFTSSGQTVGVLESGNWITPTSLAPGGYTVRLTVTSGSTPTGSATGVDLALSSNRQWVLFQSGSGIAQSAGTITLKDGGGNIVFSQAYSMEAQVP